MVGVDSSHRWSPPRKNVAQTPGANADSLPFDQEFDAVFSNAALALDERS